MAEANKNCLVMFAKYPEPGRVKTRLAGIVGAKKACDLYKGFIEKLMSLHVNQDYDVCVAYTPIERSLDFKSHPLFAGKDVHFLAQSGDDLGGRMHAAFIKSLEAYDKVIIIGTDLPDLEPAAIVDAFEKLNGADVVLGPSFDGGYYLIGLNRGENIFNGIEWSTEKVLKQQLRNIEEMLLTHELLDMRRDIDTYEDLKTLEGRYD